MKEVKCETVKEFLSYLDPADPQWDSWIFRGQSDSSYPLKPSVWRENAYPLFEAFKKEINASDMKNLEKIVGDAFIAARENVLNQDTFLKWLLLVKFENFLLSSFYFRSNEVGLKIDGNNHHKLGVYSEKYWLSGDTSWNTPEQYIKLYHEHYQARRECRFSGLIVFNEELPQHHGIPTRVLDWSSNPRKAAFFSACHAVNFEESKHISVFALREIVSKSSRNPVQILAHHKRYENKFLHAQDAVFTRIHGDFFYIENGQWPSVEALYEKHAGEFFELKKITLPAKFSNELLIRLRQCGVYLSSMMPTFNHVAEEIRVELGG